MGLPVTVYRYTDAGAPQLTSGTPSEWMNILKKVLVEGYGSKAPLGWTLEFENAVAFKLAFRNKVADGGTGGYFQFWSSTGTNSANTPMNMQCAASMSALDTFTKVNYGRQLQYSQTGIRGWEIIGTSRGFYITPHYTTNLLNSVSTSNPFVQQYFIGDIQSFIANDSGVFTIVSGVNTQGDNFGTNSVGITATTTSVFSRLYSADGGTSNYFYSAIKAHGPSITSLDGNAESLGINHIMSPLMLTGAQATNDVNGVVQNNSLTMPYCRGVVPGLYMSSFAGYRSENWPKELVRDSVTWILLRSGFYTGYWIKTGTWYD